MSFALSTAKLNAEIIFIHIWVTPDVFTPKSSSLSIFNNSSSELRGSMAILKMSGSSIEQQEVHKSIRSSALRYLIVV